MSTTTWSGQGKDDYGQPDPCASNPKNWTDGTPDDNKPGVFPVVNSNFKMKWDLNSLFVNVSYEDFDNFLEHFELVDVPQDLRENRPWFSESVMKAYNAVFETSVDVKTLPAPPPMPTPDFEVSGEGVWCPDGNYEATAATQGWTVWATYRQDGQIWVFPQSGTDRYWCNAAEGGASVPGAGENVYFENHASETGVWNATTNWKASVGVAAAGAYVCNIDVATAVIGTLTMNYASATLTDTGDFNFSIGGIISLAAGTMDMSGIVSGTLDMDSSLGISGGALTAPAAGGTFNFGGLLWTDSGAFTHSSGTVSFNRSGSQTTLGGNSTQFNNVFVVDNCGLALDTFNLTAAGTLTLGTGTSGTVTAGVGATATVSGATTVNAGAAFGSNVAWLFVQNSTFTSSGTFNQPTGTGWTAKGNIVLTGTFNNDSGTCTCTTNSFYINENAAGNFYNLIINANTKTINIQTNALTVDNNFTLTAGTFTTTDGTSRAFTVTGTASGAATLTCNASAISVGVMNLSGTVNGNTSTITCNGNWTTAAGFTKNTSTVIFAGATCAMSCNNTTSVFYAVTVNNGTTVTQSVPPNCGIDYITLNGEWTMGGVANFLYLAYTLAITDPIVSIGVNGKFNFSTGYLLIRPSGALNLPAFPSGSLICLFNPGSSAGGQTCTHNGSMTLTGDWLLNNGASGTTQTYVLGAYTHTVSGYVRHGTTTYHAAVTANGATVDINGATGWVTNSTGSYITFGASTWYISGAWTITSSSASWNVGTATVHCDGSGMTWAFGGRSLYNLQVDAVSTSGNFGACTITNTLTIQERAAGAAATRSFTSTVNAANLTQDGTSAGNTVTTYSGAVTVTTLLTVNGQNTTTPMVLASTVTAAACNFAGTLANPLKVASSSVATMRGITLQAGNKTITYTTFTNCWLDITAGGVISMTNLNVGYANDADGVQKAAVVFRQVTTGTYTDWNIYQSTYGIACITGACTLTFTNITIEECGYGTTVHPEGKWSSGGPLNLSNHAHQLTFANANMDYEHIALFGGATSAIFTTETNEHIICVGDSITQGATLHRRFWNSTAGTNDDLTIAYPRKLNAICANHWACNEGEGEDSISNTDGSAITLRIRGALKQKPRVLTVLVGVNDITAYGRSYAQMVAAYTDLFTNYVNRALQENLLMCAILPTGTPAWNTTISTMNSWLSAQAATYGYTYVDTYTPMLSGGVLNPAYSIDGIHINNAGQTVVANTIGAAINAIGAIGAQTISRYMDSTCQVKYDDTDNAVTMSLGGNRNLSTIPAAYRPIAGDALNLYCSNGGYTLTWDVAGSLSLGAVTLLDTNLTINADAGQTITMTSLTIQSSTTLNTSRNVVVSGLTTVTGALTINNTTCSFRSAAAGATALTIAGTMTCGAATVTAGNIAVGAAGSLVMGSTQFTINGTDAGGFGWSHTAGASYTVGSSLVTSTAAHKINPHYWDYTINNVAVTLAEALQVDNNFTITGGAGELDTAAGSNWAVTVVAATVAAGTLRLRDSTCSFGSLTDTQSIICGANAITMNGALNTTGAGSISMGTSTVTFAVSTTVGMQQLPPLGIFWNLTVNAGCTLTKTNHQRVQNVATINGGMDGAHNISFAYSGTAATPLVLGGAFSGWGTTPVVAYQPAGAAYNVAATTYPELWVAAVAVACTATLLGTVTCTNFLLRHLVPPPQIVMAMAGRTLNVSGSFTVTDGTITYDAGSLLNFNGVALQTITIPTGDFYVPNTSVAAGASAITTDRLRVVGTKTGVSSTIGPPVADRFIVDGDMNINALGAFWHAPEYPAGAGGWVWWAT